MARGGIRGLIAAADFDKEIFSQQPRLTRSFTDRDIVGQSPKIRATFSFLPDIAESDSSVLKDLVEERDPQKGLLSGQEREEAQRIPILLDRQPQDRAAPQ